MQYIKGSALASRVKYLQQHGTPEQRERLLAGVSPECREDIEKGLMANIWYPFSYTVEINRVLDQVLGSGDLSLIPEFGRFSAEQALHGIYKIFFKVGSPEFIIKRVENVWKQYYSGGQARVVMESVPQGKKARLLVEGLEAPARENCLAIRGWIARMLELAGARQVHVEESACVLHGAPHCEFSATWQQ